MRPGGYPQTKWPMVVLLDMTTAVLPWALHMALVLEDDPALPDRVVTMAAVALMFPQLS